MQTTATASIDLVVTSPPYPMIEMWDQLFTTRNAAIDQSLHKDGGWQAFELMHQQLDPVWQESFRVLRPGGIACINIGDATRTINGNFNLFPNHVRLLTALIECGFSPLPVILWRKQTNAPNKFMGSGMLAPGAYVTLEHEYILIVRKGAKREFKTESEKQTRRSSAYFWEERNLWFSDVWMDLKGARQPLESAAERKRSAAYPFELPYRLINMFSVKEDTVLDPFLGTGTTSWAAAASGRNSVGYEIDFDLKDLLFSNLDTVAQISNERIRSRINDHVKFVSERRKANRPLKYTNRHYRFPVVTRQEKELLINPVTGIDKIDDYRIEVLYADRPEHVFDESNLDIIDDQRQKGFAAQLDLF